MADRFSVNLNGDTDQVYGHAEKIATEYNASNATDDLPGPFVAIQRPGVYEVVGFGGEKQPLPLIVAICTPMMMRAAIYCPQAGEAVFVDSTGRLVAENGNLHTSTIFMFVNTSAGTLPIGVICACGTESRATLTAALALHRELLPKEKAFFYQARGPLVGMVDNSDALHRALEAVYPGIQLLLCLFHIVKQVIVWLKGTTSGITDPVTRNKCLAFFKRLVYLTPPDQGGCN